MLWSEKLTGIGGKGEGEPILSASSVMLGVYTHLRREILSGRVSAGSRLHQAELARRYGVSITPVREALSALTADGLVDSSPFTGSVVHVATLKEIDEVYELRALLTPMMVQRSVERISAERLAEAEKIASAMSAPGFDGVWSESNRAFHRTLDAACGQDQLLVVMGRLADLSLSYVALSVVQSTTRRQEANDEHHELLRLYAARDAQRAVEVSLEHIKATHRLVRGALEKSTAAKATDRAEHSAI